MQNSAEAGSDPSKLRSIEARAVGRQTGPIARLISPDGLGRRLKPFIFLDFFNAEIKPGFGFGMHPHSGIATLTWQPGSDVRYRDTTGKRGLLRAGGLEWMNAGEGAWHEGSLLGHGKVTGFQLWAPMPPGVEDGPSSGQYVPPEEVPEIEAAGASVKVLLGSYAAGGVRAQSPIISHHDMTYLVVSLEAGAAWRFTPPALHEVAFAFAFEGAPLVQGAPFAGELIVFGRSGSIELAAPKDKASVLLGTARPYPHPLVMGPSSVHSNPVSLRRGTEKIEAIRRDLVDRGEI